MMQIANIFSMMANGKGAASSGKSPAVANWFSELIAGIVKIGEKIWGWIASILIKLVQFMLRIVDFFQFFAGRLTGIDTWSSKADISRVTLADTDVIFRFLLSGKVRTVIISILGLSILLLIIFTIVAVVRSDYSAATDPDGKADGSKKGIIKRAGRALFLMAIVPIILVFGILSSNAVLASLSNAIKTDTAVSLGGQIFTASSYEANRYRIYADNGQRIPTEFESELLTTVYNPDKGSDALGGLVSTEYGTIFVAPMGYNDQTTAATLQRIANKIGSHFGLNLSKNVSLCNYYTRSNQNPTGNAFVGVDSNGNTVYYTYAGKLMFSRWQFGAGALWGSVGQTNIYVVGDDGTTTRLGDAVALTNGSFEYGGQSYYVIPELKLDGVAQSWVYGDSDKVPVGMYSLGYMSADYTGEDQKWNIVNAVYNSWEYNKFAIEKVNAFGKSYVSMPFENAYTSDPNYDFKALSGVSQSVQKFSNIGSYRYDGELCVLSDEYYVMADFVDWAVEHRAMFYIVDASNPLIMWKEDKKLGVKGSVATNYLEGKADGKGAVYKTENVNGQEVSTRISGFVVDYSSGVKRYYECAGKNSELEGETFILCTKVGEYYVPITQNNTNFKSSYLADGYGGVIVARGVFDSNGNPTYITKATADVDEVAYYGIVATTNNGENSTITFDDGGAFVDNILGSETGNQKAEGKIIAFNSSGREVNKEIAPEIEFSFVKVDDLYVKEGIQYIVLHFYDADENYLFTANVIGTRQKETEGYTSSLFASSTVVTVAGVSYPTLAMKKTADGYATAKSAEELTKNTIKYIYFEREDVSRALGVDFAIGSNGILSIFDKNNQSNMFYFRFKVGFRYSSDDIQTLYNLTSGSATLDYNFNKSSGISMGYLYSAGDLNFVILLFGAVLIFVVLGQAIWGLIKRIYDVVLLTIMYPAVCSTLPMDDGSRFKSWKDKIVKAVLGTYGIVLGINLFFVLLPLVREATDIFTQEDIPTALQGSALFGNADFLNRIVYLLFVLVLFTFIKTLPSLVSELVGGDDVYKSGGDVKKAVSDNVKAVGNVVSGKAVIDTAKKAKDIAGSFVPGGAILSPLVKGASEKAKKAGSDRLAKWNDKKAKDSEIADKHMRSAQTADELAEERQKLADMEAETKKADGSSSSGDAAASAPAGSTEATSDASAPAGSAPAGATAADAASTADKADESTAAKEAKTAETAETAEKASAVAGDTPVGDIQQTIDAVLAERGRLGEKAGAGKSGKKVEFSQEQIDKYNKQLAAAGLTVDARGRFHDKDGKMISDSKANSVANDKTAQMLDSRIGSVDKKIDQQAASLGQRIDKNTQSIDQSKQELGQRIDKNKQDSDIQAQKNKVETAEIKNKLAENNVAFQSSDEYKENLKKDPMKMAKMKSEIYAEQHADLNTAQKIMTFAGKGDKVAEFKNKGVEKHANKYYDQAAKQVNKQQRMATDSKYKKRVEAVEKVKKAVHPVRSIKNAVDTRMKDKTAELENKLNAMNARSMQKVQRVHSKEGQKQIIESFSKRLSSTSKQDTMRWESANKKLKKLNDAHEKGYLNVSKKLERANAKINNLENRTRSGRSGKSKDLSVSDNLDD